MAGLLIDLAIFHNMKGVDKEEGGGGGGGEEEEEIDK
jgi:hypothetical protein